MSAMSTRPMPSARWCIVALLVLCDSPLALSQPEMMVNIQVENRTSTPIQDLFIRKPGVDEWGKDVIDGSIAAGGVRHLALAHSGNCRYDVRIVFQDGRSDEMTNVDLCQGLTVVDKPGEGGTPESGSNNGSTSGSSGPLDRFFKR
jgi:hypothetical protein